MKIITTYKDNTTKEKTIPEKTSNAYKLEEIYKSGNSFHFRKDIVKIEMIK
jgi:hypothetical protein